MILLTVLSYAPVILTWIMLCLSLGIELGTLIFSIGYIALGIITTILIIYYHSNKKILNKSIFLNGLFWPLSLSWIVTAIKLND